MTTGLGKKRALSCSVTCQFHIHMQALHHYVTITFSYHKVYMKNSNITRLKATKLFTSLSTQQSVYHCRSLRIWRQWL